MKRMRRRRAGDPLLQLKARSDWRKTDGRDAEPIHRSLNSRSKQREYWESSRVSINRRPIQIFPSRWAFRRSRSEPVERSGCSHSLDEWYDPRDRDLGLKRGLLWFSEW